MSPELINALISGVSGLLGAIGLAIGIYTRRLSKEAKELRELREGYRAALSYIFELELAADQAARVAGQKVNIEKPEILKTTYLKGRADEGNSEIENVIKYVEGLKSGINKL